MAETKFKEGDRARYDGIMEKRRGQDVAVMITSTSGLVAVKFPDGVAIGVSPASLRAI